MNAADIADRVGSAAIASIDAPVLRAIRPVVERGDAVPLWGTCAGALALLGSRGRRAAIEACVSAFGASAASNGIVKQVSRRKRPRFRRGGKSSASMPSSHAATASAFAVGATARLPIAGVVLVPLAATVAISRVHERQHFVGDAVAGVALGAATAALTHGLSNRAVPAS